MAWVSSRSSYALFPGPSPRGRREINPFVPMKKLDMTEALTFDLHFVQAGFVKLP
jgi:hypothetical protein